MRLPFPLEDESTRPQPFDGTAKGRQMVLN